MGILDDSIMEGGGRTAPDPTHDHNPFSGKSAALEGEEHDLAEYIAHETREERVASFVEDFAPAYSEDPKGTEAIIRDIYADLARESEIVDPEGEIEEILAALIEREDELTEAFLDEE